jgi:hypothetical protein
VVSTVAKTIVEWDYGRRGDVSGSDGGTLVGSHDKNLILR